MRWLVLVGLVVLALGEAYFRLPMIPQRLEYRPDPVLGGVFAGNQAGYMWLANMSLRTPVITLDGDGRRGGATDLSRPFILAVGDSEWFGAGVGDGEVWTVDLQARVRRALGRDDLQVVNAAHPGHGPQQQAVVLERIASAHPPRLVLARVHIGQEAFRVAPTSEQPGRFAQAQRRAQLRRITRFLPFLVDKALAQRESIESALVPLFLRRDAPPPAAAPAADARAHRMVAAMRGAWLAMMQTAASVGAPILFVVHDIEARPESRVLEAELRAVIRDRPGANVVRLGPDAFGLGALPRDALRARLHDELTLGRDPHANARQHALIAAAVFEALRQHELLQPLRGGRQVASTPAGVPR